MTETGEGRGGKVREERWRDSRAVGLLWEGQKPVDVLSRGVTSWQLEGLIWCCAKLDHGMEEWRDQFRGCYRNPV